MTALATINQTDVFDDEIDSFIEQQNRDELESSDGRKGWSYYYAAKEFVRFVRDEGLGSGDGIRKYALGIAGDKTNTYNHKLGAAKKLARHLIDSYSAKMTAEQRSGLFQALDDLKLKKLATKELAVDDDKYLTKGEWRQFGATCKDETVRLLAAFMLQNGVRISEALGVKLSDIEYSKSYCTIYIHGKGAKDRTAEINRKLLERIRDHFGGETWLFEHNGKQYSRVSIAQRFRLAGLETIGRKVTPHMMRHTAATRLDEADFPLQRIQDFLGHASPNTTKSMYMHAQAPKGERHIDSELPDSVPSPPATGGGDTDSDSTLVIDEKSGIEILKDLHEIRSPDIDGGRNFVGVTGGRIVFNSHCVT